MESSLHLKENQVKDIDLRMRKKSTRIFLFIELNVNRELNADAVIAHLGRPKEKSLEIPLPEAAKEIDTLVKYVYFLNRGEDCVDICLGERSQRDRGLATRQWG